jgi:large subunit ribosomal protein L9
LRQTSEGISARNKKSQVYLASALRKNLVFLKPRGIPMEVILNKDINEIGKAGAIVKVKDGFARNYLFLKDLAMPATAANIQKIKQAQQKQALSLEKTKQKALELKAKIESLSVTIPVLTQQEDKEKIYGSIAAHDILNALKDEAIEIDKSAVLIEEPIKSLGIYEVPVKLHPEVTAKIKIWVVKK